jgi:hypothetical protein
MAQAGLQRATGKDGSPLGRMSARDRATDQKSTLIVVLDFD